MRRGDRRNLAWSDRLRLAFACRTYLLLDVGDGIEGDVYLGGVADRLEVLLDVLERGLAHRIHELALEVARHARQLLRPDDDQGDNPDDDQFAGVEIKHGLLGFQHRTHLPGHARSQVYAGCVKLPALRDPGSSSLKHRLDPGTHSTLLRASGAVAETLPIRPCACRASSRPGCRPDAEYSAAARPDATRRSSRLPTCLS